MAATTTIKVPVELRDRLAERARRDHVTLADAIARSLDAADAAEFWNAVRTTMGDEDARASLAVETRRLDSAVSDGLEPEDWSDVL
jgi:hypothetical protein